MTTAPWQLYVFSLVNLVAGIACFFTSNFTCHWVFGHCSATVEGVIFRAFAFTMFYLGALFSVLTYLNHRSNDAPKLKRLAMFATDCTVATLVAIAMAGPKQLGGVEKGWAHIGDMITFFVLLIVILTAIVDDKEVAGCSNLFQGLGVNPKTFLWLVLVGTTVKLFLLSDFLSYHYVLNDANQDVTSDLARALWSFMVVFILEILLVIFFTVGYGDYKDQESTVITIAVAGFLYSLTLIHTDMKTSLFRQTIISIVVWILLAIAAVVGGRREGRASGGYETVSTNV